MEEIMQQENQNKKQSRRPICLKVRVSAEEKELISKKMAAFGTINRESYMRKMLIDGYVIRVEFRQVQKLLYLLGNVSININQIAKKVNQTGSIYADDIYKMREEMESLYPELRKAIAELCSAKF